MQEVAAYLPRFKYFIAFMKACRQTYLVLNTILCHRAMCVKPHYKAQYKGQHHYFLYPAIFHGDPAIARMLDVCPPGTIRHPLLSLTMLGGHVSSIQILLDRGCPNPNDIFLIPREQALADLQALVPGLSTWQTDIWTPVLQCRLELATWDEAINTIKGWRHGSLIQIVSGSNDVVNLLVRGATLDA